MQLEISFTDKEITPWGGMVLMQKMLEHIDFKQMLTELDLPKPSSNRGYQPEQIILSFLVSVWCGANKFLHTEVTRHDDVISKIFNWKRICGQDTYKRFFNKFSQKKNQEIFEKMYQWFFEQLVFDNYTLDMDSSILTRYGEQEGAKTGYNPKKPGRKSHHPLMAFVADCRMVANLWLRSGNAYTTNNMFGFLEDTLHKLKEKRIGLLRCDSGFFSDEILSYLEERTSSINYIIAAKFYPPIKRKITAEKVWLKLDEGIEIAETEYKSPTWNKARRMVMIRQEINKRTKATGKMLKSLMMIVFTETTVIVALLQILIYLLSKYGICINREQMWKIV